MHDVAACQTVALVRHARAVSTTEDPARPLSPLGRREAEQMATWLAGLGLRFDVVRHSGKLRARQTAEVFAARLGLGGGRLAQVQGLDPHADPVSAAEGLRRDPQSVVVVGHLPLLGRLAADLVGCPGYELPIRYDGATVVLLSRCGNGYQLLGLASPALV